jgi:hypothetical protein
MRHIILTNINFTDFELMQKYLKFTKEFFIPSLKSQTIQNFELCLVINPIHEEFLRSELDFPFISVLNKEEFHDLVVSENIQIQTRHDCDDWMSPNYIKTIQEYYIKYKDIHTSFLVQSQPLQLIYSTGKLNKLNLYHEKRCSMHLSLCQANVKHHIHEYQHGQMYNITPHIFSLGEGHTKWVIHSNNKSLITKKLK